MTESREITARNTAIATIDSLGQDLADSLPATINLTRFRAAFVNLAVHNPGIFACTPESLRSALVKCAHDGLLPDGRLAAIVPFRDGESKTSKAQYLPMVQGLISRARELGDLFSVTANCVFEADHFEYDPSDPDSTVHKPPRLNQDRGGIIGAYVIFRDLEKRVIHREIMDLAEIQKVQKVSRAKSGPWQAWFDQMARKTVIRRGAKFVPMSAELRQIIERDDEHFNFDEPPQVPEDYNPLAPSKGKVIEHSTAATASPQARQNSAPSPQPAAENGAGRDDLGGSAGSTGASSAQPKAEAQKTAELNLDDQPKPDMTATKKKPGITRDKAVAILSGYSAHLAPELYAAAIGQKTDDYWRQHGGFPDEGTKLHKFATEIYNAHLSRTKGSWAPGDVDAVIKRVQDEAGW